MPFTDLDSRRWWDRIYRKEITDTHYPTHSYVKSSCCNACRNYARRQKYAKLKGNSVRVYTRKETVSNFESAFESVIGLEGKYSNDPDDPGGETKWGISKKAYPNLKIASLTLEEAKQIYWLDYWNRMLLNLILDNDIAEELFEQGVNLGRPQAVIHAQESVSMIGKVVEVDGWIGPQTIGALNGIEKDRKLPLMKCLNGFQFMRYREIVRENPKQKKFFVGWLRRVALADEGD